MSKEKTVKVRSFDTAKRAARNAQCKERNARRRAERRAAAEQRNEAWQKLSVEQRLTICKKSPFNRAKEIAKLEKQLQERSGR